MVEQQTQMCIKTLDTIKTLLSLSAKNQERLYYFVQGVAAAETIAKEK